MRRSSPWKSVLKDWKVVFQASCAMLTSRGSLLLPETLLPSAVSISLLKSWSCTGCTNSTTFGSRCHMSSTLASKRETSLSYFLMMEDVLCCSCAEISASSPVALPRGEVDRPGGPRPAGLLLRVLKNCNRCCMSTGRTLCIVSTTARSRRISSCSSICPSFDKEVSPPMLGPTVFEEKGSRDVSLSLRLMSTSAKLFRDRPAGACGAACTVGFASLTSALKESMALCSFVRSDCTSVNAMSMVLSLASSSVALAASISSILLSKPFTCCSTNFSRSALTSVSCVPKFTTSSLTSS
mmetsp:Transcript_10812/g.24469  ORF Transcript_10812/g.24469 Transcript_10812/m.24469 type:complete len:296 (-) Transcript_10812:765-1652(-)